MVACFASIRLKLNTNKTKLIWFDRRSRSNLGLKTLSLQLNDSCSIQPSNVVCDLVVLLDNELSMSKHYWHCHQSMSFHLRRIRQIKRCLNEHYHHVLVQVTRIDYCNSVLYGLPNSTLSTLTSIIHTAARLVKTSTPEITSPPLYVNYTSYPSR